MRLAHSQRQYVWPDARWETRSHGATEVVEVEEGPAGAVELVNVHLPPPSRSATAHAMLSSKQRAHMLATDIVYGGQQVLRSLTTATVLRRDSCIGRVFTLLHVDSARNTLCSQTFTPLHVAIVAALVCSFALLVLRLRHLRSFAHPQLNTIPSQFITSTTSVCSSRPYVRRIGNKQTSVWVGGLLADIVKGKVELRNPRTLRAVLQLEDIAFNDTRISLHIECMLWTSAAFFLFRHELFPSNIQVCAATLSCYTLIISERPPHGPTCITYSMSRQYRLQPCI